MHSNIEMVYIFLIQNSSNQVMVEPIKIIEDDISKDLDRAIASNIFKKLYQAIKENDEETIWNLSKIITRYRFR
ncbi:hypothetical protein ES706_02221 [subsurface metagenome]